MFSQKIKLTREFLSSFEPYLSKELMEYHYDVLHTGYQKLLSSCVEKYEKDNNFILKKQYKTPEELIRYFHTFPANNFSDPLEKDLFLHAAGGLVNHNLFFSILKGGKLQKNNFPEGQLARMITEQFGSWEKLKEKLINASKTLYLSGWVWLVYQQSEEKLLVISTHNQFSPYQFGFEPVMGIDLWEHAYLLSYYNRVTPKLTYVNDLFGFFDWKKIDERFSALLNKETEKKV